MSILDEAIPVISEEPFTPVKVRITGTRVSKSRQELEDFIDWFMRFIPPEERKQANKRWNRLRRYLKVPFRKHPDLVKKEVALKGYLSTYQIGGIEGMDYQTFLGRVGKKWLDLLKIQEKPIKTSTILECMFYRTKEDGEKVYTYYYAHSSKSIITEATNLEELYDVFRRKIVERIDTFQRGGSGWIFEKVVKLDIHIDTYDPLRARTYFPLPRELGLEKAIINLKNRDNECFKWSVTRALFPEKRDNERITKKLRENSERLNWDGLQFPMQVDKIGIFERHNPDYAINVFGHEKHTYPIRISKNYDRKITIRLLLISNGETSHYCWIKNVSRLLSSQINKRGRELYFCDYCLLPFRTPESLGRHVEYCKEYDAVKVTLPREGSFLSFKNWNRSMRVPFVIYADFECFTEKIDTCQPMEGRPFTQRYQEHAPSGFCYLIKCYDDDLYPPTLHQYTKETEDEDVARKFVESLEGSLKFLYKNFLERKKCIEMTMEDMKSYAEAMYCSICGGEIGRLLDEEGNDLGKDKVRDHDHLTGKYRGAAHNLCNLQYKVPKFVPVVLHNLAGYDAHLFIKNIGKTKGKVDCIPTNEEKYISFKKNVIVDRYVGSDEKVHEITRELRFIDSFKFMSGSLDLLVNNVTRCGTCPSCVRGSKSCDSPSSTRMDILRRFYEGKRLDLLLRKGVFPYDYVDSLRKLEEPCLPPREVFHSILNDADIEEEDYEHAQKVWNTFEIQTLRGYHDLYLESDVILLADVFENFRDICLENYDLDPAWYYTTPGLAWDAMLKKTGVELELLSDIDMFLMVERGIRGGVSMITKRYARANNKYMKDYDEDQDSIFIKYLDANNLYGWAMSRNLPTRRLKWMSERMLGNWKECPCILEVDLEYPVSLHDGHREYPLAPQRLEVNGVKKLLPTLWDKERYVVHHEALKLYESLGLKITKIHRGIAFEESDWLQGYISLNTKLRTRDENDFEKDFFKLMNNSVFGKTMENIRNRQVIKLVTNKEQARGFIQRPNYKRRTIFSEDLIAIHMGKTELMMNKPIYLGMCILDIPKILIYDFHYRYIKPKYEERAQLLFTDTDSLMYEIKTNDFYEDIKEDLETRFDTSNYPPNHGGIRRRVNKKIIGMMKDETAGKEVTKFIGLRAKLYAYEADHHVQKRCKGIKKSVIQGKITLRDYEECLFGDRPIQMRKMNVLRSHLHQVYSETVNKVALSRKDDKRIVLEDGIHTIPHGYKLIPID